VVPHNFIALVNKGRRKTHGRNSVTVSRTFTAVSAPFSSSGIRRQREWFGDAQSFIAGPYTLNHRRQKLPEGPSNISRSCPQGHTAPGYASQNEERDE